MYDELVAVLRRQCAEMDCGNCDTCVKKQAADAIEQLSNAGSAYGRGWTLGYDAGREESNPRWIPVTERVPKGADKSGELCENVWLFFDDGNVYPGWMNGITEKVYYLDNYSGYLMAAPINRVKMWQPRPEPPKEE